MEKILIVILEARDIKSCEVHISNYKGNIKINEPNKCKELVWCDINNLPEDMIDFPEREHRSAYFLHLFGGDCDGIRRRLEVVPLFVPFCP